MKKKGNTDRPLKNFIVFEGADGSGSTTQARLLYSGLIEQKRRVILTEEPTKGPIGSLIHQVMIDRVILPGSPETVDRELALLFAADRQDHLYNDKDGVIKKLSENNIVISTRYYLSSFAYHCASREDFDFVAGLNKYFPPPMITFYIDTPIETGLARIKKFRAGSERYENRPKLAKVKKNYEKLIREYRHTLFVIDGTQSMDAQHCVIMNHLNKFLKKI